MCLPVLKKNIYERSLKACLYLKAINSQLGVKLLKQNWICRHDGLFNR